jgi:hypothetical protein
MANGADSPIPELGPGPGGLFVDVEGLSALDAGDGVVPNATGIGVKLPEAQAGCGYRERYLLVPWVFSGCPARWVRLLLEEGLSRS